MSNDAPPKSSRNIPEQIKREVRQRCGFGCVICGSIVYDYDHMLNDWDEVKEHVASDITLLCPSHHREKTNGLLTREAVKQANDNPHNKVSGESSPYQLHYSGDIAIAVIANNSFTNDSCIVGHQGQHLPFVVPILIDGVPIIGFKFQDERLLLDISFFNEYNEQILRIIENQLIFKPDTWDVDLRGANLKIREGKRKIVLHIEFCPPNKLIIHQALIRFSGIILELKEDHFVLNGVRSRTMFNNVFSSLVGISIGVTGQFPQGCIHKQKVDRYKIVNI